MIKIADRFCPFSHLPGTKFPIPFSTKGVQVFPAALLLLPENEWISLDIQGPVSKFTALLDLERGFIKVFGHAEKYFEYYIYAKDGRVLHGERPKLERPSLERISFGSSKKLDWELVKRRCDLKEILPVWFRLGQMIPSLDFKNEPSLLQSRRLDDLFYTGFSGIFYPESSDVTHSGFLLPPVGKNENPFISLREGYKQIRLMLLEERETCSILPHAPFLQGRAIGLKTAFGSIDIEWTKGRLRKMFINCQKSGSFAFSFPKGLKRCRFEHHSLNLNSILDLSEGKQYCLNHFEE